MADFDTRLVIWAMDPELRLERIIELLSMEYNTSIDYLQEYSDLVDYEKTLQIQWLPQNGTFQIDHLNLSGTEFQYVSAIGTYEEALGPQRAFINNQLLPRAYRVFNKTVNAVFFQNMGRVYCVLDMSISQESRVRSCLFGQGYKFKKPEWGKIQSKDLTQYNLDSRFFYWLFSKVGHRLSIRLENEEDYAVNLVDVHAVSQLSEREVHDNRSEGSDVLGSIPALSGLGINQNVYEGGVHLMMPDMQLLTKIHSNCTCFIDSMNSRFIIQDDDQGQPRTILDDFPKAAILIYTVLFPGLKEIYHRAVDGGEWTAATEEGQRKEWALQVIKHLSADNQITLEDLEKIMN